MMPKLPDIPEPVEQIEPDKPSEPTAPDEPDFDSMSFEQRRAWAKKNSEHALRAPSSTHPDVVLDISEGIRLDVDKLVLRTNTDREKESSGARFRAQRAHMMRKLKRKFELYQPFSPEEGALKTNSSLIDVRAYLEFECTLPGSLIEKMDDGKFIIISAFL